MSAVKSLETIAPLPTPQAPPADEADVPVIESLEISPRVEDREDLYRHCRQRISPSGRIFVSKKAWAFRVVFLTVFVAFMAFSMRVAIAAHDSLIIYTTVIVVHSVLVLSVGWFGFKSRATGKVPGDLVSVIIPVFNQEKLIGQVVDAVSSSTYPNLEVVVVNDGSRDNTAAVLDALAAMNPRLKVIHKPNGGKRTAVATAFYASRGTIIVLIDSDSIVDRYAIEELVKVFSANPKVGGIVGNAKVLNANKNLLTRCQEVWYDSSFNIHKTAETTFGTVLCLSGCLSAYRREAIARFIPFWAEDHTQYSDDRSLTTYAIATAWAKKQFAPFERRLMQSMADFDDAEDRALTSQAIKEWDTVYAPTALVYTEVPETFRTFMRQQIRWRKGYLRSTFFASAFFWRKHPVMALIFYMEFMSALILPAIAFSIFVYRPIFLDSYWFLVMFLSGQVVLGFASGLDYRFRDPSARNWIFKPVMNLISVVILSWILLPALWGFRQKGWLTR